MTGDHAARGPDEVAKKLDETVTRRLYLVRQMLYEIPPPADDAASLNRMRVILGLDHAVQLTVCAILPALGMSYKGTPRLDDLMGRLLGRVPGLQALGVPMDRLHKLRNLVQHEGNVPSPEDAREMRAETQVFVRAAVRESLGKELEEISVVGLIEDGKVRAHLGQAETALQSKNYQEVIIKAAVAFKIGWDQVVRKDSDRTPVWSEPDRAVVEAMGEAARKAASSASDQSVRDFAVSFDNNLRSSRSLQRALEQVTGTLRVARHGVDVDAYERFRQLCPDVYWTLDGGGPKSAHPEGWSPTSEEALFVFDFACTTLLRLQHVLARSSSLWSAYVGEVAGASTPPATS